MLIVYKFVRALEEHELASVCEQLGRNFLITYLVRNYINDWYFHFYNASR